MKLFNRFKPKASSTLKSSKADLTGDELLRLCLDMAATMTSHNIAIARLLHCLSHKHRITRDDLDKAISEWTVAAMHTGTIALAAMQDVGVMKNPKPVLNPDQFSVLSQKLIDASTTEMEHTEEFDELRVFAELLTPTNEDSDKALEFRRDLFNELSNRLFIGDIDSDQRH